MKNLLRPLALVAATLAASTAMAGVTFYEAENFGGRQITMDGVVPNFVDRGFNDRAFSAVVEGAPVEVCIDINFSGGCTVLNPGRYPTLGSLGNKISSVRPARGPGYEPRGEAPRDRDRDDRRGRWASATLFSGPNFTGRAITLDREGADDLVNFNDRASSLRVERGYWIFCNDSQFRGDCRTFGPGDYAQLPPGFDNRISSGRRISNAYPYAQQRPNWDRDR
ncbi:MAG: beta/gamma crystallin-related protein [Betaproteobacteria bacterium]